MNVLKTGILLTLSLSVLIACSSTGKHPFPSPGEVAGAKSGDLILKTGTYEFKNIRYNTDFGIIVVPENRNSTDPKFIHLPIPEILCDVNKSSYEYDIRRGD